MLKIAAAIVAGVSLLACITMPFAFFYGSMTEQLFHWVFALASVGWFAGATIYTSQK